MADNDVFNIKLEESRSSEHYLPPEDSLGELSHFEMGLRLFCFERNRRVSIQLCDEARDVLLFPDISLLIERLPEKIAELSRGAPTTLEFSENWMDIKFAPANGKLIGTLHTFGEAPEVKTCELDSTQVLAALKRFVHEVVQLAVSDGYITGEEAEQFLGETISE